MRPNKTPIDYLKSDQSSYISQAPFKQSQFNSQQPKIDHTLIFQNYRKLRIQQRGQLTQLRMPQELKRKIFEFKREDDLSYTQPELIIFNHPFRGKIVMTKNEVEKQLQRQRKNAQTAEQKERKGERVEQNLLNDLGLQQEQINVGKIEIMRKQPVSSQQKYPRKPRVTSKLSQRQVAEQINRKEEQKRKNLYYIHKPKQYQETQKQRTQKMKRLRQEKEEKSMKNQKPKQGLVLTKARGKQQKGNGNYSFKDMPIVGQQPTVIRDLRNYQQRYRDDNQNQTGSIKKQVSYHPSVNWNRRGEIGIEQSQQRQKSNLLQSGQGLTKRQLHFLNAQLEIDLDKSISIIQSNWKDHSLSNQSSLNKELFME